MPKECHNPCSLHPRAIVCKKDKKRYNILFFKEQEKIYQLLYFQLSYLSCLKTHSFKCCPGDMCFVCKLSQSYNNSIQHTKYVNTSFIANYVTNFVSNTLKASTLDNSKTLKVCMNHTYCLTKQDLGNPAASLFV